MWLPHLADVARMTQVLSRPRRRAWGCRATVTGVRLLDARLTHPHRPESPRCRGGRRTSSACATRRRCSCTSRASPGGRQRGRLAAGAGAPARGADHAPAASSTSSSGASPRTRGSPPCPTSSPPRRAAAPCRRWCATSSGCRTAEPRVTVVRYQPEASVTLRLEAGLPTRPPSSPSTSPTGRSPTSRPGTRRCGPRRTRLAACGSPSRWPPIRYDACCGPAGGGSPAGRDRAPGPAVRGDGAVGAAAGGPARLLRRHDVEHRRRRPAGRGAQEGGQAGPGPPPDRPAVTELVAAATPTPPRGRPRAGCTLHGDFHLDQLVSSAAGPVLVDLDSLLVGPPEVDLAEFLVDLALRGPSRRCRTTSQPAAAVVVHHRHGAGRRCRPPVRLCRRRVREPLLPAPAPPLPRVAVGPGGGARPSRETCRRCSREPDRRSAGPFSASR